MAKRVNEDGQVWAVPVGGLGWCSAVVARSADPSDPVGFSLVYLRPMPMAKLPEIESVPPFLDWETAWIGLVGRRPFSTNRWTLVGSLTSFARDQWPVPPWQETAPPRDDAVGGWSIATTADRPTMTVLANDPQSRATVEQFPTWQIVTAPSSLEKSLMKLIEGKQLTFHEMRIETTRLDGDSVRRWNEYASQVRSRSDATEPQALPAGRKTDRSLVGGEWIAFPATGGGFGVGLFLPRPPKHFRVFSDGLMLIFRSQWSEWPTHAEASELTIDDAIAIGQTSMICVRDGRWRVLGRDVPFDAERWPLPTPWELDNDDQSIVRILTLNGLVTVDVDPEILKSDTKAGGCWSRRSCSYRSLETYPGNYATDFMIESTKVTPERVSVWRHVNTRIELALGKPARELWFEAQP